MNITIIISNFNYGSYVCSALDSCLSQTDPCKIIVVDDCSSDESWNILKNYNSEPNVKVIQLKQNSGGNARGKNVGIALSDTEYVSLLDSDDMFAPYAMNSLFDPDFDFVHGYTIRSKSKGDYSSLAGLFDRQFVRSKRHERIKRKPSMAPEHWSFGVAGNTVLAKRILYEQFGLYDEEMKWKVHREMLWRWLSHGSSVKTIKKFVSIYRKHSKSVTYLAARKKGPKSKDVVRKLFKIRRESRKVITENNTLLLQNYDPDQYIGEIM